MRILFVISSLRIGGAQRVLSRLASHLEECGHEIHLATQSTPNSDEIHLKSSVHRHQFGSEEDSAGLFAAIKNNLLRITALRSSFLQIRPDVVISFLGETNVLAIIATCFSRTRVVVNERSNLRVESIGGIWNILRWILYRFATVVIANTKDSYSVLSRYVRRSKLRLIANPIFLPSHNPKSQRSGRDKVIILTVSRCAREKGIDVLLNAIKYLLDQGMDRFTLRIVGDGPCLGELMQLSASIGVEGVVEWCGKKNDVEEYYRDADIFVLASRYEGMPNVLLEATAYRLPIVVTESSDAVRRFINQNANGILVPIGAPEELGRALQTLLANPKKRKILSEKGINAVSKTSEEAILGEWKEALLGLAPTNEVVGHL